MGAVYKARDTMLGRIVAIKVILTPDAEMRKRFLREAQAAARLHHDHIVTVHDLAVDGDTPYLVMEFVDGESLLAKLERNRLSPAEALRILGEAASALDYSHAAGVVHRDVKLANVMITRAGRAKLADFGIARIAGEASLTLADAKLGTPKYMAPEVLKGAKPSAASDQFALAVMAFYLLTGSFPFDGEALWPLLHCIMNDPAPEPTSVERTLPKGVDGVVLKALSKEPAGRYGNCCAFVDELRRVFRVADEVTTAPGIIIGPKAGEIRENPKDGLQYVWIPPGLVSDGSVAERQRGRALDEKPRHLVRISRGFWIGQTPVTVAAWKRFAQASGRSMPTAPGFNKDWAVERQPIVNVSWDDAQEYCEWAGVRLPTEAEWGVRGKGWLRGSRYGPLDEIAWHWGNSGGAAHEVGLKRANAFGLHDVTG